MTTASDQALDLLTEIDHALGLAVANYTILSDLRTEIRGGEGVGTDVMSGPVPQFIEDTDPPHYDIPDMDCPCNFLAESETEFTDTGALLYTPVLVSVLPGWALELKTTDEFLQRYADALLQAIYRGRALDCTSITDYLMTSVESASAVRYRVVEMTVEGGRLQPRLDTRVQFLIPATTMTNLPQGIVQG